MKDIVEQVGIETVVAVQESIQESMALVSNYYIFGAFFVVIVSYFFLFHIKASPFFIFNSRKSYHQKMAGLKN